MKSPDLERISMGNIYREEIRVQLRILFDIEIIL